MASLSMNFGRLILFAWLGLSCLGLARGVVFAAPQRVAPPPGLAISETNRIALTRTAAELGGEIAGLRDGLRTRPELLRLLPDVEIYHKAVDWALAHDEFFRSNEVAIARELLQQGLERARQLQSGSAPWTSATGLVVRGYVSKIDGSVQPYGLVVPVSFGQDSSRRHRLDVWLHGRDNHLTELKFINDRQKSSGEFAPADTFVLHPYGRYCNAFKFAGEVDVFEAIDAVARSYPMDSSRRAIRGFSMGGAGCWHLATHHPGFWKAAAPGAGFAETPEYTRALIKEPMPAPYEQTLWHLYDATDYAGNLFNCPTLAYSGELDKQKQAADIMARTMKAEGLELAHLIGPGVEHKYEPKTKLELARRFDGLMATEFKVPRRIHFTTWTLRYNRMGWLVIDALVQHWARADVRADIDPDRIALTTSNVAELTLMLDIIRDHLAVPGELVIDGQMLSIGRRAAAEARLKLRRKGSEWTLSSNTKPSGSRKRHGLQGPIDDAFMDSFIVARPMGTARHEQVGRWVDSQLAHFTNEWRSQFRGHARVKDETEITKEDIENHNLILWGDPASNRLLARILKKLPVRWTASEIRLGEHSASADRHVPVLIYPNPLNPTRYVVVNSGFTFCESGNASNAQQTPKLPDFAIVDVTADAPRRGHHQAVQAGFFNEQWELPARK